VAQILVFIATESMLDAQRALALNPAKKLLKKQLESEFRLPQNKARFDFATFTA